ncbi:MAG TPA: hypothetical protein VFO14_19340, partial [Vicinamibacterales bacterium]|nr:hypothetical protein [Vicinamibacterales bacterium]
MTLAAGIVCGWNFAAQQQPPREQQPFRTGVHAIEVDVRVFDEAGRFVTDLTRGDFEILENGEVQQLEALYLIGQPAFAAPTSRPPIDDDRAVPVVPSPATSRQTWIFVFDTNHLVPGAGFDRAKKAVTEFLRTRFKEGDVGGILAAG